MKPKQLVAVVEVSPGGRHRWWIAEERPDGELLPPLWEQALPDQRAGGYDEALPRTRRKARKQARRALLGTREQQERILNPQREVVRL